MIDKATIDLLRAAMREFPELRLGALLAAVRKGERLTDFTSADFAKVLTGEITRYSEIARAKKKRGRSKNRLLPRT